MVCACLMYDYRETTVSEALEYFATMRTNITKHGKLQGVETPSQLRYCKYFYQLIHITDILKMKQNQTVEQQADGQFGGQFDGQNANIKHKKMNRNEMNHNEMTEISPLSPTNPNLREQTNAKRSTIHRRHESHSQNTRDFYKMVIAATPQRVTANGLSVLEPLSQEPTRSMDGQSQSTTTATSSSESDESEFEDSEFDPFDESKAITVERRSLSPSPMMDLSEIEEIQRINGRGISMHSAPNRDSRIIDDETRREIVRHFNSDDLNISGLKKNRHGRGSDISASLVHTVFYILYICICQRVLSTYIHEP